MTSMEKGWDSYSPNPGEWDYKECRVCGLGMEVDRDEAGPLSLSDTLAGKSCLYDHFYCDDAGERWHIRARDIMKEAMNTQSQTLRNLLLSEAKAIVADRCYKDLEEI